MFLTKELRISIEFIELRVSTATVRAHRATSRVTMLAHKHTSTQAHKHTSTQAHRHTSTQAHRHTSTQAHKSRYHVIHQRPDQLDGRFLPLHARLRLRRVRGCPLRHILTLLNYYPLATACPTASASCSWLPPLRHALPLLNYFLAPHTNVTPLLHLAIVHVLVPRPRRPARVRQETLARHPGAVVAATAARPPARENIR